MTKTLKPKELIGKTIESINAKACNVWHIKCTDGTEFSLTYEPTNVDRLMALELQTRWK